MKILLENNLFVRQWNIVVDKINFTSFRLSKNSPGNRRV